MAPPCILIVESDIRIRQPLAEYLRECGYKVIETSNAREARTLLNSERVAVDVVLADATAGGESGFALATWVRANHPRIKIILAGSITKAAEKAGDLCHDGPALSKPYDYRLVLERIRRLMGARKRGPRDSDALLAAPDGAALKIARR